MNRDARELALGGLVLLAASAISGCREGGEPRLERPAPSAAAAEAGSTPALPRAQALTDDPRLGRVKDAVWSRDWSTAARAADAARASASLDPADDCEWTYLAARLHFLATEWDEAASGFDHVSSLAAGSCPLAGYAALRAAQAYLKLGRADDAAGHARTVPGDIALHDDATVALGDALAAKGDKAGAVPIWRSVTGGSAWIDVAVKLATALLDGAEGEPAAHAEEARQLATRVVVEVPRIAESSGAEAARRRAIGLLRASDPKISDALSDEQRVKQARAWLDAGEPAKALVVAGGLVASLPKAQHGGVACAAAIARAQATPRGQSSAIADAWGDAIERCAGDDARVTALFAGGKASVAAKRLDEGADRFAKVESLFPAHRFADDARLQGGLIALSRGDEARFESMLLSLPDDYPQGDMRGEALFRVALQHMQKGDWAGAEAPLDRVLSLFPADHHWATAGRAAYFRARAAAAAGKGDEARDRYLRIVADDPLAFYMTRAYAALAAEDPSRARKALDDAVAREEAGSLPARDHAELHAVSFDRALRLLEVGETDAGHKEVVRAGLVDEHADPDLLWAIAVLYARAGAPELARELIRARLGEFQSHYPAGRWRAAWETAYPQAFGGLVERASGANGIPRALTWAVMREESDFFPEAKSPANAYGLMQLIVPTARGVASGLGLPWNEEALKRPDVSIALGTKFLSGLRLSFAATPALAIAAYNAGSGAVGRWASAHPTDDFELWVEEIPFEETRGYLKRVLSSEAAYGFLYDRASLDEVLSIPVRAAGPRSDGGVGD